MKTLVRLLGLVLLPLSPAVAAWAVFALRRSGVPEDRSYFLSVGKLAEEGWHMLRTGDLF